MSGAGRTRPAPGHNNVWMRTKMNRYDLSLWDVGKRSLYGRETISVQAATLAGGLLCCHPEQASFAQRGTWASRATRRGFCHAIIARLARFLIKLGHPTCRWLHGRDLADSTSTKTE